MHTAKFSHILLIIVLGISSFSYAQNYVKVVDADTKAPLPYANVKLTELSTGKTTQTISNEQGEIALLYSTNTLIELSYIGYLNLKKEINPLKAKNILVYKQEMAVDEIVVTGSPVETKAKNSAFQVKIIDKETIEQRAAVNLADLLKQELNIQISNDGILGSQITMQGLGGYDVKIMIDGVPVIGRLDGNVDLNQINMNNIERIEIVEGPLSTIYGSNAIAGVINLISKQNQKNTVEGAANFYYESVGTYNADAFVGYKKKQHYVQFNAGRYFFDGWNPGDFDRDMQWNPKEQYFAGLSYTLRGKKDWFHKIRSNYFQDRILNRYDPTGALPIAFDDWYYTKRFDASYAVNGKINEHLSFNSTNSYNFYSRVKNRYKKDLSNLESNLVLDTEGNDNQDTTQLNQWMTRTFVYWDNPDNKIALQGGIDVNVANGSGGRFKEEDGSAITMVDAAFFASATIRPNKKIILVPALRYGYNNKYKTLPTPSFQFKYAIKENLTLRLNYGMGFRTPSLKELYLVFNDANHNIFGNKDLEAESSHNVSTSVNYETAIKQKHLLEFSANVFYNYKFNAILLTPNENLVYRYINVGEITTVGAQMNTSYQFKNLQMGLGFSYIGLSNSLAPNENDLYFSPQLQSNISYSISKHNLTFNLFNKWNGSRFDFRFDENDNAEQVKTQAFNLLDLSVQKGFWKNRIQFNLGVKNLMNVTNIIGASGTGGAHGNAGNTAQIGTGRTYFVGVKIRSKQ